MADRDHTADDYSYRQFTVKYRQIILEELRNAESVKAQSAVGAGRADRMAAVQSREAGALAPLNPRTAEAPAYCEIEIEGAEKLSGGSLLFPLWNSDETCGWCLMVKSDRKNLDLCDEYEILGRIQNNLSGPEFIYLAYKFILDKKLDETTIQSDWSLVESRRITRRGVLKMFLESGDAGLRNRQFLLVPDPSPWLAQIEGVLFQNDAFSAPKVGVS